MYISFIPSRFGSSYNAIPEYRKEYIGACIVTFAQRNDFYSFMFDFAAIFRDKRHRDITAFGIFYSCAVFTSVDANVFEASAER